jgi:hypothetical protein
MSIRWSAFGPSCDALRFSSPVLRKTRHDHNTGSGAQSRSRARLCRRRRAYPSPRLLIHAVEFAAVERQPRNDKRLAVATGDLDPGFVAAGMIFGRLVLGDNALVYRRGDTCQF